MSSNDARHVGFWRALGNIQVKDIVWPEGLLALVIGGGGSVLVIRSTTLAERTGVMPELLALAGALLAVVFTALAIVVSLPSSAYLRMLADTPQGGMRRFLEPFLLAVGTQLAVILLCLAYSLLAGDVAPWIEQVAFGLVAVLFTFGLLDVASLARQLVRHGVLRAQTVADDEASQVERTTVTRLPNGRS